MERPTTTPSHIGCGGRARLGGWMVSGRRQSAYGTMDDAKGWTYQKRVSVYTPKKVVAMTTLYMSTVTYLFSRRDSQATGCVSDAGRLAAGSLPQRTNGREGRRVMRRWRMGGWVRLT